MNTTAQRVIDCIVRQQMVYKNDTTVSPDMRLEADIGMDSLDKVELSIEIEDEFNIDYSIPDEDIEQWETVQDVIDYVSEKVKP